MITFSVTEFSALRRAAQDKYTALLLGNVTKALESRDFDRVLAQATKIFTDSYRGDTSEPLNKTALNAFVKAIEAALGQSTKDSDPQATALMLSLAALNSSAIAAADADPEPLELEWVGMDDSKERPTHKAANGQTQPPGNEFTVGDTKMPYPGFTDAPIEEWINCRCVLRPTHPLEHQATAALLASLRAMESEGSIEISEELFLDAVERGIAYKVGERDDGATLYDLLPEMSDEEVVAAIVDIQTGMLREAILEDHFGAVLASSSGDHSGDTSMVVVALPAADDPVHGMGDEQKHVTLAYMGDFTGDPQAVHNLVQNTLAPAAPFTAAVSGNGELGPDKAKVLFVEAPEIAGMRAALESNETTGTAMATGDAHPHFVPHMTLDYAELPAGADGVQSINFDRVAVWQGEQQTEYALGQPMPVEPDAQPTAEADTEPNPDPISMSELLAEMGPVPWHGVLASEGEDSGDGRVFLPGSLTNRDLPFAITFQEVATGGHDNGFLVAICEQMEVIDGLQHAAGHFLSREKADVAIGQMADFNGRFGVSVDADAVAGEYDEATGQERYSAARTSGACIVNIPALPNAWVALGPSPVLPPLNAPAALEPGVDLEPVTEDQVAPLLASAIETFKRGPGWITDPVATKRIHDYWTVPGQPGYAKIAWGVPDDFYRCRLLVGAKIAENSPLDSRFINQICAQWHHDALGIWPGQEDNAGKLAEQVAVGAKASLNLVASAGWAAPSSWFIEPEEVKAGPMGVTITPEGRTFGYIAVWGECHIGLPGVCTAPPESPSNYAYFKTGLVPTAEGGFAEVGQLTIAGGHADERLGYRGTVAHYDNTCSVWADVSVGENDIGIWFAGSVRPGISEDMIYAARASGRLSGDWRDVHDALELTGALSVNVAGFQIPKVSFAAQGGRQTALVAAGIVPLDAKTETSGLGAEGIDLEAFATKLADLLEERETIRSLKNALEGEI